MLGRSKKNIYPVGVDLNAEYLKIAQLGSDDNSLYLHAAAIQECPDDVEFGSSDWQRWVVGAAKKMFAGGGFSGKGVIASIPSENVFIEQIKVSCDQAVDFEKAVHEKMEGKLPFKSSEAMINYVVTSDGEDDKKSDVLVMAAEKDIVNRHLAIYEKAGLEIKGISVWPLAMANSFVRFFGRRSSDEGVVVMLINLDLNHSKIVICKQKKLLFARMIPIGLRQMALPEMVGKLISETGACCRYFESVSQGEHIQRMVFLSSKSVDEDICEKISKLAERMQVPAQIGDVLAAVDIKPGCEESVDRRRCQLDWAIAFGLSLTDEK